MRCDATGGARGRTAAARALPVVALLAALPAASAAQEADAPPPSAAPGRDWFGLPVLFYSPETSMGFGAAAGVHLRQPGSRPSSFQVAGVLTLERQFSAEAVLQLFDAQRNALFLALVAARFPYREYGTGPLTPRRGEQRYTTRHAELLLAREWAVAPGLRVGPKVHLRAEELVEAEAGGRIATGALAFRDYASAGAGVSLTFDDRDDAFWPARGTWVEAWVLGHAARPGQPFLRASAAVRHFLPLGPEQALGVEARADAAGGDVPFTLLPRLGGARGLRGYYEGRWRDRALWSSQAEWRFPIAWRLKGTLFAGAAGVAPSLQRLGETRPRPAAGAGLRLRLTPTGLHVRLDAAAGEDGPAAYLLLGEAF